jgi:hypothetical protein
LLAGGCGGGGATGPVGAGGGSGFWAKTEFCAKTGKLAGMLASISSPANINATTPNRAAGFIERPQLTPCSQAPAKSCL